MQGGNHCCFSDARNQTLTDRRSRSAHAWLASNFGRIGVESSVDLVAKYC
jgi:hypothetical protein